jgi:DNA-binding XRE family transcriptional regulator
MDMLYNTYYITIFNGDNIMDDATLLNKLAEYRETHNLTQAELANLLGVTRESLYRWLNGKVKLRASNKRIIKSILKSPSGVNINEFDRLTSELLSEWKCLGRSNRLKVLQYIEEIKTPEELKRQTEQSKK